MEKINVLYRILICKGIIVLCAAGYLFLFIMPQFDEIQSLHDKNRNLATQLNTTMSKSRKLDYFQQQVMEAENRFDKERRVLPENEEIRRLLESVAQMKQESGLTFTLFRPQKEISKDFYAEIPISMKLTGHFHNVGVFFDKISKLSRLVHINNFNVASAQSEKDISLVVVSCEAITYKFIKQ